MTVKNSLGIVTIAPNEYVYHTRLGKTINQGLGKTFFQIPFIDSYVKFSITPQKIEFFADNISIEKQGIGIKGFMIWSIKDGDLAYKKINPLDNNPTEKLSSQLTDISISIVRHTIANMKLNEVLTKREVLVSTLTTQLDSLLESWGLKIETIEIKEVRVLSEELFSSLQAPFRNEQLKIAELSRLEAHKYIENTATETETSIRIQKSDQETKAKKIEIENKDSQNQLEHDSRLKEAEMISTEKIKLLENTIKEEISEIELTKDKLNQKKLLSEIIEESKRFILENEQETERKQIELSYNNKLLETQKNINMKEKNLSFINFENDSKIKYQSELNTIKNDLSQEAITKILFEQIGNSLQNMHFDNVQWYSMSEGSPMSTLPKIIVELSSLLQSTGLLNKTFNIQPKIKE